MFTKVRLIRIRQLDSKPIYVGKISFTDLKGKEKITMREVSGEKLYQRPTDKKRIKEIARFLQEQNSSTIPFATPLVMAASSEQDLDIPSTNREKFIGEYFAKEKSALPVLLPVEEGADCEIFDLYLPIRNSNYLFIVDGQHRYQGVKQYYQDIIDDKSKPKQIEFMVSFLIDYSLYEQSEVFANINFKHKPVNKSLYYDIFGSIPGRNIYTFTHFLIKYLNTSGSTNGIVKMLGSGNGIISLAFFMETLIKSIDNSTELSKLYESYESDSCKTDYKKLPELISFYFEYFFDTYETYCPNKVDVEGNGECIYKSSHYKGQYLLKAVGVYGLISLFGDLLDKSYIATGMQRSDVSTALDDLFGSINEDTEKWLFDNVALKSSGSASLQVKFYRMLYLTVFGDDEFKLRFPKIEIDDVLGVGS